MPEKDTTDTQLNPADFQTMSNVNSDKNYRSSFKNNRVESSDDLLKINVMGSPKCDEKGSVYSTEDHSENSLQKPDTSIISNRNIFNHNTDFLNKDPEKEKNSDTEIVDKKIDRKSTSVLKTFSVKELRLLTADLAQTVKEVSSQLVSLLQENDTLRQESDARNIAIEQLLKLTVKQAETELRPIKMSVISLPSDTDDEWE